VDACGPDHSVCDPNTPNSCAPDSCLASGDDAASATHGGQVGANIGIATPFTPDSQCIHGEWTHVRHLRKRTGIVGNNGTDTGLNGNFHGRSFDSLLCACLPCAQNPDSPGVVGTLCNPDDRICGPEPRRAPDNEICFTGVGDYTMSNGKRTKRSVAFRVDVQDRSEPGGSNGPPPPDRYRIRLWYATSHDLNDTSPTSIRALISCGQTHLGQNSGPNLENLAATTAPPDIDDGGDLFRGNQQIHPPIKDTCVIHGNK